MTRRVERRDGIRKRRPLAVMVAVGLGLVAAGPSAQGQEANELPLDRLTLPPGFSIEVYAEGLQNPRSMVRSPGGILFVGSRPDVQRIPAGPSPDAGHVYAVLDHDGDQQADEVVTVLSGLHSPNGVAFNDGALYVAEINRILRYEDIEDRLRDAPDPVVVNDTFPTEWMHGWKFIALGPDGKLYVPVGAPCNVCDHEDDNERFSTIMRMNLDGSDLEVFARGIRNSVGFDFHPDTGALWFTNNGRDMLGDERPPDTLHRAPEAGAHFGFPFCHAGDIADPEFGEERSCTEFRPPAQKLGPHVGALGMRFYTGEMFPEQYRGDIFIAEHGSWNRTPEAGHTGYRLTVVHLEGQEAVDYEVFAEGWLGEDNVGWGRPVDVLVMPDGALLVTDDRQGVIYRISSSE